MTSLSNWQKSSSSPTMIVSFSNTSKPDLTVGLPQLSHRAPPRVLFIWLQLGKEDQVLYKILRKKVISALGGGVSGLPEHFTGYPLKVRAANSPEGCCPHS